MLLILIGFLMISLCIVASKDNEQAFALVCKQKVQLNNMNGINELFSRYKNKQRLCGFTGLLGVITLAIGIWLFVSPRLS